ncbi:MAG: hypothetical protein ACYCUM_13390, partial [Solirubrobacteraceae bacterium]
ARRGAVALARRAPQRIRRSRARSGDDARGGGGAPAPGAPAHHAPAHHAPAPGAPAHHAPAHHRRRADAEQERVT